jgi:hypothetical protein
MFVLVSVPVSLHLVCPIYPLCVRVALDSRAECDWLPLLHAQVVPAVRRVSDFASDFLSVLAVAHHQSSNQLDVSGAFSFCSNFEKI